MRKRAEILLTNAKKDRVRLYAEIDSLKGEKERMVRDKATQETWWLYMCSFLPGKAAEFAQRRQQQEAVIVTMIGRQRTKERSIHLKLEEIRTLEERIQFISSAESKIKAGKRKIEEEWLEEILRREQERTLSELRKKSEQAYWAGQSTHARFTRENSHFHQSSAWEF